MTTRGGMLDAGDFPGGLFAVACPACGKSLAARGRDAGRGAKCPCCGAGLLLPASPSVAVNAARRPATDALPATPGVPTVPAAAPLQAPLAPAPTFEISSDLLAGATNVPPEVHESAIAIGGGAEQVAAEVRERRARERRRARRSLFMLVIGSAILLGIVFAFTGFGGRR